MPSAGGHSSGSHGGHSSGGGHHSSSFSSGGHHVSRSGGSSYSSSNRSYGGGGYFRRSRSYGRSYGGVNYNGYTNVYGGSYSSGGSRFAQIFVVAIVAIVLIAVIGTLLQAFMPAVPSTIERTKLDNKNAYINDCVVDEIGYSDHPASLSAGMREFFEDTGVQPYVYFKAYDSSLTSDAAQQAWANQYYESNFDRTDIFLLVYFANPDVWDFEGYWVYVNGAQSSSIMDAEAMDIFWSYLDRFWSTDMSVDDILVSSFQKTGDVIMKVTTSYKDVLKYVVIFFIVVAVGVIVILLVKEKSRRAKEKAEETERILNTPLERMQSTTDSTTDKYLGD